MFQPDRFAPSKSESPIAFTIGARDAAHVLKELFADLLAMRAIGIGRHDPTRALADTALMKAFHKLAWPVPSRSFWELDRAAGAPSYMEEIEGCTTGSIMAPDPYGAHREKIGKQFLRHGPHRARRCESDRASDSKGQAIRWKHGSTKSRAGKRRSRGRARTAAGCACRDPLDEEEPPPPRAELALVHGDYRSGNFLFDSSGDIAAFSWENGHLAIRWRTSAGPSIRSGATAMWAGRRERSRAPTASRSGSARAD